VSLDVTNHVSARNPKRKWRVMRSRRLRRVVSTILVIPSEVEESLAVFSGR
jgi:hypothetical protein